MSSLTGPNFYKIDFEREVVLQGKSTTFLTINRNADVLSTAEDLYVVIYPNSRTFESVGTFDISQSTPEVAGITINEGFIDADLSQRNLLQVNNVGTGLYVKNTQDFLPNSQGPILVDQVDFLSTPTGKITKLTLSGPTGYAPYIGNVGSTASKKIDVGYYSSVDGDNWKINGTPINEVEREVYNLPPLGNASDYTIYENPFDGTTYSPSGGITGGYTGTGMVSRDTQGFSSNSVSSSSSSLANNRGLTIRIDYEGSEDSHLKLNLLIFRYNSTDPAFGPLTPATPILIPESVTGANNPISFANSLFGFKSGDTSSPALFSENIDYQEVHLFGYKETTVRTDRTTYQNSAEIDEPLYEDRSSFSLLKTNPKISGNVKLTVDSQGELTLNSFNANPQLSDSKYKRVVVSPDSQYQRDLHVFFKDTPKEVIYQLYQVDDQYQNTKRSLFEQYDNFYNYGVEQLASKFYNEDFSFLAPLWMRKVLPDFFVIFRVDHPGSSSTYDGGNTADLFNEVLSGARIVKTFDIRSTSKLGRYLRKTVNDPRFKERPLDVSYEQDVPTTWNGISYKDATITGKSEFLSDFWKTDQPIKELETYITEGFERNGIISANLINLEFLFDDPEAPLYSINRYFGLYVTEMQLAELELASSVLGKIPGQTPPPKPGVDGEPYSTRPFVQTNPGGIELPVEYYHSTKFENNTSIVPYYQGNVVGKLPLPAMVDDPLRIFYVKDREDVFKRVIGLTEVDYGFPGNTEYRRVTQLRLFDTKEDISKYGGPSQITSQLDSSLLNEGNSQLVINLINQGTSEVIADEEELVLSVKNYNTSDKIYKYDVQVTAVGGTATSFVYFQDQSVESVSSNFTQPSVGNTVSVNLSSTQNFVQDETVYIVNGGFYKIIDIASSTSMNIQNIGSTDNVSSGSTVSANSLVGSFPTGFFTYTYTALDYRANVDNNLTLDLEDGYSGSSSLYTVLDSFNINVDYPSIIQTITNGSNSLNAIISQQYTQYRWRMLAKAEGLAKGSAWPFPVEDPNGYDYISNFNNEGTLEEVAKAIAACVNSFENSPAYALADGSRVFLKSKLKTLDGNTIEFSRIMRPNQSYTKNLGYYEDGNAEHAKSGSLVTYAGNTSTEDLKFQVIRNKDICGEYYYYVGILKTSTGNNIIIRKEVDPSYWYTVTSTGSYESFFTNENVLDDPSIPFSLNFENISEGVYQYFVIKVSYSTTTSQFFIGGTARRRSRAKILQTDSQRYYQNRRISVSSTLTSSSNQIIVSSVENIFVGALVEGTGIPSGAKVISINSDSLIITIDKIATVSGNYMLSFGDISILNDNKFLQQWFQTAKSSFSRLYPWNVQGKWIYSLPYLEDIVFDERNIPSSFTDSNVYSIIQVENQTQEFYQSTDKRIVAYDMYRPILGVFKIFPIKEFDFDFFLSEYSYTPVLETERYFFNETIEAGQTVELPTDENYVLVPQIVDPSDPQGLKLIDTAANFGFMLEGKNQETDSWDYLAIVSSVQNDSTNGVMINTYTPFYRYDIDEHPQRWDDDSSFLIRGSGMRNFERVLFTKLNDSNQIVEVDVKKFRMTFFGGTGATHLNIKKADFSKDQDLIEFEGFAGLQDILNQNDQQFLSFLKSEGNYVDAYLRQLLKSEYDRLRENFTKEFATFSRVVPFVNKWVQEGTDARDNYYRLNNSMAFGLSNLSPDDSVDYAEPLILSHEFPYLDTLPKDYPEVAVEGSRSYMFAKLSDIAHAGKTWYDLLTTDNTNNWFLKYFAVGYPTEIDYYGEKIPKSREERFTFLTYNQGIERVQTLFRGAKIQIFDIDTTQSALPIIEGSTKYDQYKFAAIQRTLKYRSYEKESPLEIEVIKNEKYKSVLIIITKRIADYRTQSGLNDYLFGYAADDNLKNSNQNQYSISNFVSDQIPEIDPYYSPFLTDYTSQATARPRNMFMGGGYLQIGDPKLSGFVDTTIDPPTYNTSTNYLSVFLKSSDPAYPFIVSDEVNPFSNRYPVNLLPGSYPFVYDLSLPIIAQGFGIDGFLNKFVSSGTAANQTITYDLTDVRAAGDSILLDSLGFTSPSRYQFFRNSTNIANLADGLFTYTNTSSSFLFTSFETYNLQGGNEFYSNTKNLSSFANIKKNINSSSGLVKYYKVNDNGKVSTNDFRLFIVTPDQIIKNGVLNYRVDTDRPPQYANAPVIGYDIVNTNQNELVIRHRGSYEPKTVDVISFWVREDAEMTAHFEKDFLLMNTRINNLSRNAGLIKNYGINKVADQEILNISQGSAYKSVYQYINEISIDNKDVQVLQSTWDSNYYRRYSSLTDYENVNGYNEMREFKSFLGSKAMSVPKALDIQTFIDTEVQFFLKNPAKSDGLIVDQNDGNTRPILEISLDLEARLIRELLEGILTNTDEWEWGKENLGMTDDLTQGEIDFLKESYVKTNILPLYEVTEVSLYSVKKDGVPIFVINLSKAQKIGGGYRIDKDCKVTQLSKFGFSISKVLDTKQSFGYSIGVTIKRI